MLQLCRLLLKPERGENFLHYLSQPADHPINIFHPEGAYLKGVGIVYWIKFQKNQKIIQRNSF